MPIEATPSRSNCPARGSDARFRAARRPSPREQVSPLSLLIVLATLFVSQLANGNDIIVDNGDPGTIESGYLGNDSAAYGGNHRYGYNTMIYTWPASLPSAGRYRVFARWVAASSRSPQTTYTIESATGTHYVDNIDQRSNNGLWQLLGEYDFNTVGGSVSLTPKALHAGGPYSFSADAVKFVPATAEHPPLTPPQAAISAMTPNPAVVGTPVAFSGSASDADGVIASYSWRSSLDGVIGVNQNFVSSTLSEGTHTISFTVTDNDNLSAQAPSQTLVVSPMSSVLQIDFNNNVAGPYSTTQLQRDMPSLSVNFTGTFIDENFLHIVRDSNAYEGASLRVTIPANIKETKTGISANVMLNRAYNELYLSYRIMFSSNFQWPTTGKLLALSGPDYIHEKPDGQNGFSTFTNFASRGKIVAYIYHMDQEDLTSGDTLWDETAGNFPVGRWVHVLQHLKLNTPGRNDGLSEMWVDGKLAFQGTAMRFRSVESLGIERVILYLRANYAPGLGYIYFDKLRVSEQPIDP